MKSSIMFIGPGRNSAFNCVSSSTVSGLYRRKMSRMPGDSNWNTPEVSAV